MIGSLGEGRNERSKESYICLCVAFLFREHHHKHPPLRCLKISIGKRPPRQLRGTLRPRSVSVPSFPLPESSTAFAQ